MDGTTTEETNAEKVARLKTELADAEQVDAISAAAGSSPSSAPANTFASPADPAGDHPAAQTAAEAGAVDPGTVTPANPTGAVAAEPAAAGTAGDQPALLDQLHETLTGLRADGESPHTFLEGLRTLASKLEAEGRIVAADLLSPAEQQRVHATLIKLFGEVVGKL